MLKKILKHFDQMMKKLIVQNNKESNFSPWRDVICKFISMGLKNLRFFFEKLFLDISARGELPLCVVLCEEIRHNIIYASVFDHFGAFCTQEIFVKFVLPVLSVLIGAREK